MGSADSLLKVTVGFPLQSVKMSPITAVSPRGRLAAVAHGLVQPKPIENAREFAKTETLNSCYFDLLPPLGATTSVLFNHLLDSHVAMIHRGPAPFAFTVIVALHPYGAR